MPTSPGRERTWPVTERDRWPAWVFWLLVVVMFGVSVLNTALRMSRSAGYSAA